MAERKQPSFAGGEIAPSLYARTDIARYAIALRTLRNFFVGKSGGAFNRPGTEFLGEVKDSSKQARLIEFVFNDEQTYVLEFGDEYMRVWRDGARVTVSASAWSSSTSYVVGDLVSSGGVSYYCILAHSNQAPPNATYWYPLTGSIFEIPTPYGEDDLMSLDYAQNADVITIVHKDYAPRELARTAHTGWTLTEIEFEPSIAAPENMTRSPAGSGNLFAVGWTVIAISASGEESPLTGVVNQTPPSSGNPITIEWDAVDGAVSYKLFRGNLGGSGESGLLIETQATSFVDTGQDPVDTSARPPAQIPPFASAGDFPSAVVYSQQRLIMGGSENEPETARASRLGSFKNFFQAYPAEDDDPVNFTLAGNQVHRIRHLREMRQLLALTSGGVLAINGDEAGILRPDAINSKRQSGIGAGDVRPLDVGDNILYVQARGSIIRDLGFNYEQDGYGGNDLTIFSTHLFRGKTIVDWAYQNAPNSIIWAVRSDGVLLALTYVREHEMLAWSRHDTDGEVERVCVVPEGTEDRVYVVVKRTIDGETKRYIERMHTRDFEDIEDAVFMDSSLTHDGRNDDDDHTMTLSGGTTWAHTETLTLTSSAAHFEAGDVGNQVHLTGEDGTIIRFTIKAFTSDLIVTGKAQKLVPTGMRNVAISDWADAVDQISGLDHLEGEEVAVFADGFVKHSPNNASYTVKTVSGGAITLDRPHAVIHVGLPYLSDIETLGIDSFNGEKKLVSGAELFVERSRGIWVGGAAPEDDDDDPLQGLREAKLRTNESYDEPTELKTEKVEVGFGSKWTQDGRLFVRQVDPVPLAVLSVTAQGFIPAGGR